MPVASSVERVFAVPAGTRAAMVALGFLPALHVLATLGPGLAYLAGWADARLVWFTPAILYLLPPVGVRLVLLGRPLAAGRIEIGSGAFLRWWFTAQSQMVFARLPWLDDALRLIPGLYSLWLRVWGSRIGSLVYWSPGVVVIDRSLVIVGDRVAFGAGARVVPHVIAPGADGRAALFLAPVTIGDDALVGAYSTLLLGSVVAPGEITLPFKSVHAYTRLAGGRRTRLPRPFEMEAGPADPA